MAESFIRALDKHSAGIADCQKTAFKSITQLAMQYKKKSSDCEAIAQALKKRMDRAPASHRLGLLLLTDWLLRNCKDSFRPALEPLAPAIFFSAYHEASSGEKSKMNKVKKQWIAKLNSKVAANLEAGMKKMEMKPVLNDAKRQKESSLNRQATKRPGGFLGLDVDSDIIAQFALGKRMRHSQQKNDEDEQLPYDPLEAENENESTDIENNNGCHPEVNATSCVKLKEKESTCDTPPRLAAEEQRIVFEFLSTPDVLNASPNKSISPVVKMEAFTADDERIISCMTPSEIKVEPVDDKTEVEEEGGSSIDNDHDSPYLPGSPCSTTSSSRRPPAPKDIIQNDNDDSGSDDVYSPTAACSDEHAVYDPLVDSSEKENDYEPTPLVALREITSWVNQQSEEMSFLPSKRLQMEEAASVTCIPPVDEPSVDVEDDSAIPVSQSPLVSRDSLGGTGTKPADSGTLSSSMMSTDASNSVEGPILQPNADMFLCPSSASDINKTTSDFLCPPLEAAAASLESVEIPPATNLMSSAPSSSSDLLPLNQTSSHASVLFSPSVSFPHPVVSTTPVYGLHNEPHALHLPDLSKPPPFMGSEPQQQLPPGFVPDSELRPLPSLVPRLKRPLLPDPVPGMPVHEHVGGMRPPLRASFSMPIRPPLPQELGCPRPPLQTPAWKPAFKPDGFPNFPDVGFDPRLLARVMKKPDPLKLLRQIRVGHEFKPLFLHRLQPLVEWKGTLRAVRYTGPDVLLLVDDEEHLIPVHSAVSIVLSDEENGEGFPFCFCLGGPFHELIIGGRAFRVPFGSGPLFTLLGRGSREVCVKLEFPGPEPTTSVLAPIPDQLMEWAEGFRFGPPGNLLKRLKHPLMEDEPVPQWTFNEYEHRLRPLIDKNFNENTGQSNVFQLFDKLVQSGLIAADAEPVEPEPLQEQPSNIEPQADPWVRLIKDYDINLWADFNPYAVRDLHTGSQCQLCGVRFPPAELPSHLQECLSEYQLRSSLSRRQRGYLPLGSAIYTSLSQ